MIRAHVYKKGEEYRLTIKGHSGTAPRGADLVCAAATTAAYQCAQVAREMHAAGKASEPRIMIRDGKATIAFVPTEDARGEAEHTLYVVCTTLRLLAHNYPRAVQFQDDLSA